ncbi:hypothetical protein HYALB_00008729 [Hymenoscyphus albidus]|uniref:Histone-lysine N-methyltransferase, H3 lysine-79 specific n=1 Tax=Hymenoscyphus albidus TaxID=595503 RepID=A0A9N9Q7Q6_9HELO|nr:hypothetical protein HYALB_00008729 [Hymenoscyphus albidus]
MSLFGNKNCAIKPRPAITRIISQPVAKKPASTPLPSKTKSQNTVHRGRDSTSIARSSPSGSSASAHRSRTSTPAGGERQTDASKLHPRPKRPKLQRASPSHQPIFDSDDDDEASSSDDAASHKRRKMGGVQTVVDSKRSLRSRKAFSNQDGGLFPMIHAADLVAPLSRSNPNPSQGNFTVKLKYPSASQRERYDLQGGKDVINSIQEIIDVASIVTDFYMTEKQAEPFRDPNNGYIRQLEKARNNLTNKKKGDGRPDVETLLNDFKTAVRNYNVAIDKLRTDGSVEKNLDDKHHLPFKMVRMITTQAYDRTVSPRVDDLKKYEAGSNNVYGELRPKLVSEILGEADLKSDHVFVDLGSGVGNVVLQAALEFGCESWGCEMMVNAYTLADAYKKEFTARCRLWGIAPGSVRLEHGDFLENAKIHSALERADVILVNNQVFSSDLNRALVDLFLDLKDGCKIISLKPFVPKDHEITTRNINDAVNNLKVIKKGAYSGQGDAVSWSGGGGDYFITVKDAAHMREYAEALGI